MRVPISRGIALRTCGALGAIWICGCERPPVSVLPIRADPAFVGVDGLPYGAHRFSVRITNTSNHTMRDLGVSSSCYCVADLEPSAPFDLKAQESTLVSFTLTQGTLGPTNQALVISQGKAGNALMTIPISGQMTDVFKNAPWSKEPITVKRSFTGSMSAWVETSFTVPSNVTVKAIRSRVNWLESKFVQSDDKVVFSLRAMPTAKDGLSQAICDAEYSYGTQKQRIEALIKTDVKSAIIVSNPEVWWGEISANKPVQAKFQLTGVGSQDIVINPNSGSGTWRSVPGSRDTAEVIVDALPKKTGFVAVSATVTDQSGNRCVLNASGVVK